MLILPSIIPYDKTQLETEMKKVSFAPLVQVDICDGQFVKNKTWPYSGRDADFFDALVAEETGWPQWETTEVELHLMVSDPEKVIEKWIKTGITSLVIQVEALSGTDGFEKIFDICKSVDVSLGLAIKPSTDIEKLSTYADKIDFIQCMGSDLLGQHGIELDLRTIARLKELRTLYPDMTLAVDIGVNEETAEALAEAGATKLVAGSDILDADNPEEVFEYLQNI